MGSRERHVKNKNAIHQEDAAQTLLELRAIFDNAAVGIVVTRGRIVQRCNHRAAEIFGYGGPEDVVGQPSIIIYPDEQSYARMGHEAGPLLEAGRFFHADWLLRKADGNPVWCNVYGKAIDPQHTDAGTVWVLEDVTEAKRAEQALRESKAVLDTTFEYMDQGMSISASNLQLLASNRRFRELLDFPEWLCRPGAHFSNFIRYNANRGDYGPGDPEEQVRTRVELAQRFEPHQFERDRPDGITLEIRGMPVPGVGFVSIYTDVTKRARAERAMRKSEERFRRLTALSSDWFWEQDAEFRLTRIEGRYVAGCGGEPQADLGRTWWELGFEPEGGWERLHALLEQRESFHEMVFRRVFADGDVRYFRVSGEPVPESDGGFTGYWGVGRDVTEQKQAEERIQYLATHDSLTSLPNRVLFQGLLNLAVQSARRYERELAVLFIDLDWFKRINDTLGHEAGDTLLREIAVRLSGCLRTSDVVARLGGDEFVVLVQEVSEPDQVAAVARKIISAVTKATVIMAQECRVTASIGICMFPAGAQDERTLMKNADSAMYVAKQQGKNDFRFYSGTMTPPTTGRP